MTRSKKHIVWMACLSLAVFLLPLVAKEVHILETCSHHCSHSSSCADEEHDCTNCRLCQFTFSTFITTDSFVSIGALLPSGRDVETARQEHVYRTVVSSFHLRAPPVFV